MERVKLAYDAMVLGRGNQAQSAKEAVAESYKRQEFDEFVKPTVIMKNGSPVATVGENDSIIFFNFRPDRAREITRLSRRSIFQVLKGKKDIFRCSLSA